MLSKPLDYILKWKGHVLKEEQSEAADRGELVPHPAACGESPVCWQTGEEEEPRVFQIKLCQSKVLMWPLYEEEMYALSFIHSNKRPQVRSNHLHWLFLLFALCYTWWTDLCVGFFVDFFFFSEEDYRWFTWFLLCLCSTDDADRAGAIASLYLSGIHPQPKALLMYSLSAKVILQA